MSTSGPPLTADDLIRIFNDPEGELLNHKFNFANVPGAKCQAENIFHMDVPFDATKAIIDEVRKDFFEKLDSNAPNPTFEHIGSTSIKGMPGSLSPDVLIIEDQFPPSASTVRAITAIGFHFVSLAPHGNNDYWFFKILPADKIGPVRHIVLHLIDRANPVGRVFLRTRDTCNNDPDAFEEYKAAKLAAKTGSFVDYKIKKSAGLIQRLRKEEGLP